MSERLSDECYEILSSLSDPMVGKDADDIPTSKGSQPLLYLCSKGYIEASLWKPADESHPMGTHGYALTPEGQEALSLETKRREREAEEEKRRLEAKIEHDKEVRQNRKHQYLVALLQFFLGVVSGLFLEHYAQIIAFVTEFIETTSSHS